VDWAQKTHLTKDRQLMLVLTCSLTALPISEEYEKAALPISVSSPMSCQVVMRSFTNADLCARYMNTHFAPDFDQTISNTMPVRSTRLRYKVSSLPMKCL
jgi:hypothetical protein